MIDHQRMLIHTAFWENEPLLELSGSNIIHPELGPAGDWFIGFGSSYFDGFKVSRETPGITMRRAWVELRADLWEAGAGALTVWDELLYELPHEITESLIMMVFQMGAGEMGRWKDTRAAATAVVESRDFVPLRETLREALLDSEWRRNANGKGTPRRALWTADRVVRGHIDPYPYRYGDNNDV